MKFLSPEVALCLYKSTIWPCMEYCCHVWAGAASCYLELLYYLQKRIYRPVGHTPEASLEPLVPSWNVACLSLFSRYYVGRCSSELARLVPLPYSRGRSTCYSDRLHVFLSLSLDVTRMPMSTVSFLGPRPWNYLPLEAILWPMI